MRQIGQIAGHYLIFNIHLEDLLWKCQIGQIGQIVLIEEDAA